MTPLERRYRRLLAAYPWSHRRQYEEEMLAVLLAGAAPDQRRPGVRDTVNVLVAAASLRLHTAPRTLATPAWSAGAAVTGLLASMALLAASVDPRPTRLGAILIAGWAAVALSALLGWRRPAAGLAWLSAGWQVVLFIHAYAQWPVAGVDSAWAVVLAVVAASALTVARTGARALVGGRRLLVVGAALGWLLAVPQVNRLTAPDYRTITGATTFYVFGQYESTSWWLVDAMLAAVAIGWLVLGVAVLTLAPPIRRRLVVFLLPVAVPFLVDRLTLAGWRVSTGNMGHAVPLVPAQWLALFGLPVLVGLAGAAYLQRREHMLHLVELGRSADVATQG